MPNRSRGKWYLGISAAIALAVIVFLANDPFRNAINDIINRYQGEYRQEAERANDVPSKLSPGEMAHNEHYFGLGRLGNGDYRGAIDKFTLATSLDPGNPEYHANLAIAYEKDGQHDNAIGQFTIALMFQPNSPDLLSWLGSAYFSKKQWKDAAKAYDGAIE